MMNDSIDIEELDSDQYGTTTGSHSRASMVNTNNNNNNGILNNNFTS